MNDKFAKRLEEYLSSECSDYSLEYEWSWNDDTNCCEVVIKRNDHTKHSKELCFQYNEKNDDLTIELSEDSFYITREFDKSVKYFWMLIAPAIFPNK